MKSLTLIELLNIKSEVEVISSELDWLDSTIEANRIAILTVRLYDLKAIIVKSVDAIKPKPFKGLKVIQGGAK